MTTEELPPEEETTEETTEEKVVLEDADAERLSRFLALVLRHRAHQFRLDVDDEGFVHVDDLLDVIDERQRSLDWVEFEHLEALTERPGRRRFEIKGERIRATYGHSFHKPIRYEKAEPPEHLFIGVPKRQMLDLKSHGLRPDRRQYIHLSEKEDEAREVGRHQDENILVVTVRAREAAENGVPFYHPTDGIFLTSRVEAAYLNLELAYGRTGRKRRRR